MHEGAFARHLTSRSIDLALLIEDGLVAKMDRIGDFMVNGPVSASAWQPLSFVRHVMLANSFSYLPVWIETAPGWRLISDFAVASYVRSATSKSERRRRLSQSVREAVVAKGLR
jgi:hypothetical protein